MAGIDVDMSLPACLARIVEPSRFKVFYGGRGSGKSWSIARWLLVQAAQRPLRVLCTREIQDSIDASVYQLLVDQIGLLGLGGFYEVLRDELRCLRTGSTFIFSGLRHKIESLKSTEGIDYCWVEEGQSTSKASWQKLIPTIRKPGSEIWVSLNPELDTDETYVRFIKIPPPNTILFKMNWRDNKWFNDTQRGDMEADKARNYADYLNIWEGECKQAVSGAVYAEELREAQNAGRITHVPYERGAPVRTFWDLGRADNTSIWFAQRVGFQFRVLDFYEANNQHISHFFKVVADKPYTYDLHCLPHDADFELLGQVKNIAGQARDFFGANKIRIVPKMDVVNGINAARSIFPQCWFDTANCDAGIQHLRRYRYDINDKTGKTSPQPVHDEHSHAADAFRYLAVMFTELKPKKAQDVRTPFHGAQGWMG